MKTIQEIHNNCKEILQSTLMNEEGKASNACKIYDVMIDGNENCENCIGENFNQLIHKINNEWFENYKPSEDLDYYFFNYCLLLYLFVERVDFVFEVINKDGKSKLFNDFHHQNFPVLRKINKWANFIKHPKEFLFTHWPTYYLEGSTIELNKNDVLINTQFIFDHYFSDKKPRPTILENNANVYVEIPNLEEITKEFCKELNLFFDFICQNKVVFEYLKKKSTIENYYKQEE